MAIKPILFSGPMVRKIRSGHKTQTRRAVKPYPVFSKTELGVDYFVFEQNGPLPVSGMTPNIRMNALYQVGDILWVREAFAAFDADWKHPGKPSDLEDGPWPNIAYAADEPLKGFGRPSIHMPRWACRLFLRVVSVRVARLHAMSEEDAYVEGVVIGSAPSDSCYDGFQKLWDDFYGECQSECWDANPWVWVFEFERTTKPAGWPGN